MMRYLDFAIPAVILLKALVNFTRAYKFIADKGELYYIYKQDWKEHISSVLYFIAGIGFILLLSRNNVDLSSLYIYEKYYTSPIDLFNTTYYDQLYDTLLYSNRIDLNALVTMKRTLNLLPSMLAVFIGVISSFAPTIFSAGIYGNGVFDAKNFYPYEDIKAYKIEGSDKKPLLVLILKETTMFSHENKEVGIPIRKDEISEILNYLRHEIKDDSTFEKNVQSALQ